MAADNTTPLPDLKRLPIHHPEYRYPPSPNPYWSAIRDLQSGVFLDNDTEIHRGSWLTHLSNVSGRPLKELHVEIGCNGGHVVLEWAARNPDNGYLGLDWKFKQIHRGCEKAAKKGIRNLAFLRAHAARLGYIFGPAEIDRLYLLFSDPWPKKSQWNNRLVTPEWLRVAADCTRAGGYLEIRTDHVGYFEWMEKAVSEVKDRWQITERSTDCYHGHPDPTKLEIPDVTLFERLFVREGIRIHRLQLLRR